MPNEVPYSGSILSKIYIIGDMPSPLDCEENRLFQDAGGKLLAKTLSNNGIRMEDCRLTTLVRTLSPTAKFDFFLSEEQSLFYQTSLKELKEDIKKCSPSILILLGNDVFEAIQGKRGVDNWRGSVLWNEELQVKVLPTYHPTNVIRQWDYFPLFSADMNKVKREGESKEYTYKKRTLDICPSLAKVKQTLEELEKSTEPVAFDIETTPIPLGENQMFTSITAIAFSNREDWAFCIPFTRTGEVNYWNLEEEGLVWKLVKHFLESPIPKIGQNAQYDMGVLKGLYGITVNNLLIDTLCAFHTLYPELPKDLATISSIYTDQPYYKHLSHIGSDITYWQYNALDACVTYEAGKKMLKELEEEKLLPFYNTHIHPLIQILLDVHLRGVKIDVSLREKLKEQTITFIKKAEAGLKEVLGRDINVNSPKQLKELLYDEMGLPPKYKRGTKKATTDEETLKELNTKYPSPLFDFILSLRHLHKLYSTYLDVPLRDDRIHASYNIGGRIKEGGMVSAPETGRLSSSKSIIFHTGTNLQNIPSGDARRIFIPDEAYCMVGCDGSQAEVRVVAHLAEETKMISVFQSGGDIHRLNASWIYEKEPHMITKEERYFAKTYVHGFDYGMGVGLFSRISGLPYTRCREIIDRYFDTFPAIRIWHLRIQKELGNTRTLYNLFGRRRIFFGRWGEDLFKEAYAYIPQSTIGDWTNYGLIKVEERLNKKEVDAQFLLQIHDGLVWQVKVEDKDKFIVLLKECFNIPIKLPHSILYIPIEISVGKNWEEMEEVK